MSARFSRLQNVELGGSEESLSDDKREDEIREGGSEGELRVRLILEGDREEKGKGLCHRIRKRKSRRFGIFAFHRLDNRTGRGVVLFLEFSLLK